MKRLFCLILCLVVVGCGNSKAFDAAELEKRAFVSKAELVWQDKNYQGDIKRPDASSLTITLSGENLEVPICYEISQGGYKSTQGELEMTIPLSMAQPQSVADEIYNALSIIGRSEITEEGNKTIYKTPLAVLKYDRNSDVLISLETANGKVIFKDFSFIEKEY